MRLTGIVGAFSSRNYRLFFAGQAVSLAGAWMTQTASLWLIYHLTSSPALLGVIGFATLAPIFIFAPFAGVLVDRVNRHHLLVGTQVAAMIQAFSLAALTLTNTITVTLLVGLSLVQGVINALDMPVRQALVIDFVERKEHLGSAIALNSALFNLARLMGPALGGIVIAAFGPGICYLIDGFSFLAVIGALLAMRIRRRPSRPKRQHPLHDLREGFDYTRNHAPIRALIILVGSISAVGFSSSVLMPVFARDIFHGDSRTLGWLLSASGAGALSGALYLSTRKSVRGLGLVIRVGGTLLSAGLVGLGLADHIEIALFCAELTGLGGVLVMASSNTLIQTLVADDKRGRVMSLYAMAFTGTMPFGNLLIGWLAGRIGAVTTLVVAGLISATIVFLFHLRIPRLRAAAGPILARLEQAAAEPPLFPADEESNKGG